MRARDGLLTAVFVLVLAAAPHAASLRFNAEKDGTLDLAEMEAAAAAAFERLNKDQDTTLDYKEVKGRVDERDFFAADPDKDMTLTKEEYVQMAERLFKAADINNDGVLDTREMRSHAGRALDRLLQ